MRRFVLFATALLLSLLFTLTAAHADTWQILPDGTGDAPTIQAGIDSAANGDEVVLADGIFTGEGNRDIELRGKAITVRSGSGNPEACIVELFMEQFWISRRGFRIHEGEGANTVLSGFTVQNGHMEQDAPVSYGGGIFIDGASPLIQNCNILDCSADQGGGICIGSGGSPVVSGCEFRNNGAYHFGGGLGARQGSAGIVEDCLFAENLATARGGGISIINTGLNVSGSVFEENNGGNFGGGIWSENGSGDISDCAFRGNWCWNGAGICFWGESSHSITGCVLTGGISTFGGGILSAGNVNLIFRETTIAHNMSTNLAGGLILDGGSAELIRTIFWGNCTYYNSSTQDVRVVGSGSASFECCLFDPNKIGGDGTIEYIGTNVFDDPLFCDPVSCEDAPTPDGDYTLHADSPALDHPECGLIGALGEGCGGTTSTEKTSWGGVKKLFR